MDSDPRQNGQDLPGEAIHARQHVEQDTWPHGTNTMTLSEYVFMHSLHGIMQQQSSSRSSLADRGRVAGATAWANETNSMQIM